MADLTTLPVVKAYLNIEPGVTAPDALLSRLITASSAWFETQIRRTITATQYTEYFDGDGSDNLTPLHYPIIGVTSLHIDGEPVDAWSDSVDTGYAIVSDRIELIDPVGTTVFTRGKRNVKLVYTANYSDVPADVAAAVIELVAWRFREKDRPGQTNQSSANTTVSFSQSSAPQSVRDTIEVYANVQRLG